MAAGEAVVGTADEAVFGTVAALWPGLLPHPATAAAAAITAAAIALATERH